MYYNNNCVCAAGVTVEVDRWWEAGKVCSGLDNSHVNHRRHLSNRTDSKRDIQLSSVVCFHYWTAELS